MKKVGSSPIKLFFLNKWVWFFLVLNLIMILGVVLLYFDNARKTALVNFMVTPVDATITIDGNSNYKNNGVAYYFEPGIYEVKISHESLDTKLITVELEENHNTTIAAFLSNDGNFEFYELSENISSYNALVNIASSKNNITIDKDMSAENFIENVQKNFKLMSDMLPVVDKTPTSYGLEYGVNYQYNILTIQDGSYLKKCEKIICLYITDTSGNKEEYALSVIKKFGFDVDLCQIIYEKVGYE